MTTTSNGSRYLLVALLAVLAAYVPFTGGGLMTDDFLHVAHISRLPSPGAVFTKPDAFGFFRPVTQLSLWLDAALVGASPEAERLMNVALHGGVLWAAYYVATLVLTPTGAMVATLAFALTPKAHPIAVLWISARSEILMALWSLLATSFWIRWTRQGGGWRFAGAIAGYVLALLSKETAVLLPAVWLFAPGPALPARKRWAAVGWMGAAAAVVLAWRTFTGALMPSSADPHYTLFASVDRWERNAQNYFWRAAPAPLALWFGVGVPAMFARAIGGLDSVAWSLLGFSAAWTAVLLVPVLPIVARSELYLYLPTFGLCLIAGHVVGQALDRAPTSRTWRVGLVLCTIGLGGYQVSISAAIHRDLVFSRQLVSALAASPEIQNAGGSLVIIPADTTTAQYLRDTVGGYLNAVVPQSVTGFHGTAAVDDNRGTRTGDVRMSAAYDGRTVTLRRVDD
ncbi:MAG: hypothetical protein ABL993_17295 [Vicinamibacterales bacterium]